MIHGLPEHNPYMKINIWINLSMEDVSTYSCVFFRKAVPLPIVGFSCACLEVALFLGWKRGGGGGWC